MAYIGRDTDKISNIEKLDTITFDGSSSYTLQKNSVNFTPNSANSLQVSIDGVVQAGNFTVSGSVIDFGVAIPATSTNDFIFHYGTGLITTPADGTVTTAKIQDGAVTYAKTDGNFGKIGQVIQTHYTSTFTKTQSASVSDITDFNATITPSSTSSKVLCIVDVNIGFSATVGDSNDDPYPYLLLLRGATSIGLGTGASSNRINTFLSAPAVPGASDIKTNFKILNVSKTYLDSPSTISATTYKLQLGNPFAPSSIAYINRPNSTDDNYYIQFPSSCLTLMEVLP